MLYDLVQVFGQAILSCLLPLIIGALCGVAIAVWRVR